MADWFKFYENDIDETRLQYAIANLPEVLPVWVGILSELCRHKSDTIRWGDNEIELFGFSRRLNISIPKVNEAVNLLVKIDYIERGENTLKVLKWSSKQSEYCQKKDKRNAAQAVEKSDSVPTVSRQCPPRGEERREEKNREEKAPQPPKGGADAVEVLNLLNSLSGRSFRQTDTNLKLISARLAESGVTLDGVKKMMERQAKKWKGTTMAEYLRPETLFNKTKFDAYYASKDAPIETTPPGVPAKKINPQLF